MTSSPLEQHTAPHLQCLVKKWAEEEQRLGLMTRDTGRGRGNLRER